MARSAGVSALSRSTRVTTGPESSKSFETAAIDPWLRALEDRHLADLRFSEVTRALRALSSAYVERRVGAGGRVLDGAGKRAAFALFYGPLHCMLVHAIVRSLPDATPVRDVLDVGCGTGAAGAAWALASTPHAEVAGMDVNAWALAEAAWTYRTLGLHGRVRRGDAVRIRVPSSVDAVVAAFAVNELSDRHRADLLPRLTAAAQRGARVLIVEPIATSIVPWWPEWRQAFERLGGRADEWRFRLPLPDLVRRFDRAAGLRHDELTGRTLYLNTRGGD